MMALHSMSTTVSDSEAMLETISCGVIRLGEESGALGNPGDVPSAKKLRSARFIWLLLVVNLVILVIALMIAALCCRRVGSVTQYVTSGPYTYIPGVML